MALRPMHGDDAEAVVGLMDTVWGVPPAETAAGVLRVRHLVGTDPGGAWVSEDGEGAVDGAALALLREGLWGLSLLIVRPARQSGGVGRALMERAVAYGDGARGGIILASDDPRALRTYWRAGYALRPTFDAKGEVRTPPAHDPAVREARWPQDRDLVDAASRHARGAAHGPDVDAIVAAGNRLLVHDGGGFIAVVPSGRIRLLAATDDRVARALLETVLADGGSFSVEFLDARQTWAHDVCLAAGLKLVPAGPVCVRGELGPLVPYIPSGSYL